MTNDSLHDWLLSFFKEANFSLTKLAGDASFREYYRVKVADKSYIAMDARAEKEKCPPFVAIANALRAKGLCTPEIFAADFSQGFLLLSDLGDTLFLKKVSNSNADVWYGKALQALHILATLPQQLSDYTVPFFEENFMREELFLFQEWFLEKYLACDLSSIKKTLAQQFALIAKNCATQPKVFMHRDFHSANLMIVNQETLGILDFQDAFIGPITYDLVSLLRDCYIDWPQQKVFTWVSAYHAGIHTKISRDQFQEMFDWMSVQRHLKALLTFSRKWKRDHNANYLQYIPRTLNYVLQETENYPALNDLRNFLQENVAEKIPCAP